MKRLLDLRTGKAVWTAYRSPGVRSSPLQRNLKTDVLIVGAGISGAMIAEMLTSQGFRVAIVDRRGPLEGSTAATTALVQYELDTPLTKLKRTIGRDNAEAAWRRSRLAVANLRARIEILQLRCGLTERPSLYLAGDVLDAKGLEKEVEARREAGLYADLLKRAELKGTFGISRQGAILSPGNLELDPRKLTAGLLNHALSRGAEIYAPVEATTFESDRNGVSLATKNGPDIRAAYVVLATGYELASIAPSKGHEIISTWAIATKPQPRNLWPQRSFIWEASDPYLYLRTTPDGRIICGGEDEPFEDEDRRDALIGAKTKQISRKLAKLLPHVDPAPEFAWTGSFGTTTTGLPIIGKVPGEKHIYCVMGYGGNGITFSRIAAELITSSLMDGHDADAALFAPKIR